MRRVLAVAAIGFVSALVWTWVTFVPPKLKSEDEKLFASLLAEMTSHTGPMEEQFYVNFKGSPDLNDGAARQRVFRVAQSENVQFVEYPTSPSVLNDRSAMSGVHMRTISLEIVEWRAKDEVVVKTGSYGGGSARLLKQSNREWRIVETYQTWVH